MTPSSADLLRVGCVIVDYHAGAHLHDAVTSVLDAGVHDLVVVDNAGGGATRDALGDLAGSVRIVEPGRNLGFGAGVNRGVAVLGAVRPGPRGQSRHRPARGSLRPACRCPRAPSGVVRRGPHDPQRVRGCLPVCQDLPVALRRRRARTSRQGLAGEPLHPAVPRVGGRRGGQRRLGVGSLLPRGPRARSSSSGASTSGTSCSPRTWTCAGGRTRRAEASGPLPRPW